MPKGWAYGRGRHPKIRLSFNCTFVNQTFFSWCLGIQWAPLFCKLFSFTMHSYTGLWETLKFKLGPVSTTSSTHRLSILAPVGTHILLLFHLSFHDALAFKKTLFFVKLFYFSDHYSTVQCKNFLKYLISLLWIFLI